MNPKPKTEHVHEKIRDKSLKIDQIKQVTKRMIEEQGFFEITNHGIAYEANVSVGLLYKYFPQGKIDIFRALLQEKSQPYEQSTFQELNEITLQNYREKLYDLLKIFYQFHVNHKAYIHTMEIAMLSDPESFADYGSQGQDIWMAIPVMEKLQELGLLNQSITRDQILLYFNVIDQIVHQYLLFRIYPLQTDEEFYEYLLNLCMKLFEIKLPVPT